ncbi:MAG: hypothetical protein WC306_01725 [Candidatus Paceibacterota bacterium]
MFNSFSVAKKTIKLSGIIIKKLIIKKLWKTKKKKFAVAAANANVDAKKNANANLIVIVDAKKNANANLIVIVDAIKNFNILICRNIRETNKKPSIT